jgi:hypothetical protein
MYFLLLFRIAIPPCAESYDATSEIQKAREQGKKAEGTFSEGKKKKKENDDDGRALRGRLNYLCRVNTLE